MDVNIDIVNWFTHLAIGLQMKTGNASIRVHYWEIIKTNATR